MGKFTLSGIFSLLIIYFSTPPSASFSQNPGKIDSLKTLYSAEKNDSLRITILHKICWEFMYINLDSAMHYATSGLNESRQKGSRIGIARNYNNMGVATLYKGEYEKAIDFFNQSVEVKKELGNLKELALSINNLGICNLYLGHYDKSVENYLEALKLNDSIQNREGIGMCLNNIGMVYENQGDYDKALEYYRKAFEIYTALGNKQRLGHLYNNIGTMLIYKKNYEEAIRNCMKSYEILKEVGDAKYLSQAINNIGGAYNNMGKYSEGLKFHLEAYHLREKMQDQQGAAESLINIATSYRSLDNYDKALEAIDRCIRISERIGYKTGLKLAYLEKSNYYQDKNDFRNAYEYHRKHSEIKDSLLNEENNKQIAEMQGKYESEKKQKEIELLNKEKDLREVELEKKIAEVKKQNTQKIAFGVGFALVFIIALVILRGYRQKAKSNRLLSQQKKEIEIKNTHLEKANHEISIQKKQIEEKNHEILSSIRYAQRIQEAILPPQKLVKSYLEQSFILYKPKDIVAGDFYWMEVVNGQILFAACDCTGHGVPGAFVSIVAHNALNRAVKEFGLTKPSAILDKVNELVQEAFVKSESDIKDGMDIALCSLEFPNPSGVHAKLQFAGANNSIYLIQNGILREIKADVQPIGKYSKQQPFTNHIIDLKQSDCLYAFTDGYADQFGGPKGKKFKYRQFENLLLSICENAMEKQHEILNDVIEKWKGDLEQVDDICIIGLKI